MGRYLMLGKRTMTGLFFGKRFSGAALALIAVCAAGFVLAQKIECVASDNFAVSRNGHKVFTWGFPFNISDANPVSGLATTVSQTAARLAGNFLFFFLMGCVVAFLHSRIWQRNE